MGNIELYEHLSVLFASNIALYGCGKCLVPSQEHADKFQRRIDILVEPRYIVKRGRQGERHGPEELQYHHGKTTMLPKIARNECTSVARRWRDDASCRDTQQEHGRSLEHCMFLDNLKKIPITHRATQGERNRYKNHFVLKWKNPTNSGNMSIHENFTDAEKSRATMACQGHGYAYIPKTH